MCRGRWHIKSRMMSESRMDCVFVRRCKLLVVIIVVVRVFRRDECNIKNLCDDARPTNEGNKLEISSVDGVRDGSEGIGSKDEG